MFKKFLTYYRYQKSIRAWAVTVGYEENNIDWIFTWTDVSKITQHRSLVVVFGRALKIRGYTEIYNVGDLLLLEKTPKDTRRVRFGIPSELHHQLLKFVRLLAEAYLNDKNLPEITATVSKEHHPYLEDSFTVDVGVWVDGNMRGSRIVSGDKDTQSIATATINCLNDSRLKPIMPAELARAIFEITIVPNIWLPVDESYLNQPAPHTLATRCMQFGSKKSIYVPMIANHTPHATLYDYLGGLYKKGQLTQPKGMIMETAPAYPAVEDGRGNSVVLCGPYPQKVETTITQNTLEILRDNILNSIDSDGFVPIVQAIRNEAGMELDLARMGFIFFALAEYCGLTNDEPAREKLTAIHKLFEHILSHHAEDGKTMMAKIYINQASASVPQLISHLPLTETELRTSKQTPLTHIQYVKQMMQKPGITSTEAAQCLIKIRELFIEWKQSAPAKKCPVQYADLLWLLTYSNLKAEAEEFAHWLRRIQYENGSFLSLTPVKIYTRSTGKIAEAAASSPETHDIAKKAFNYLRQLQYSDATMYHIPLRLRDRFRGGFRHDAWNRDLWLDGSAHVLLAELRLLHASAYKDHLRTCLSGYHSALLK